MADFSIRPVTMAQTRPLRQAVLRPHQSLDQLRDAEPPDAWAAGAFADRELIAVGWVAPDGEPGSWRVRGMATAPHARGRGAGSAVLHALLREARSRGARRIWCKARLPAVSLYERAGLRVVSEPFEVPEIGWHVVMECRGEPERLSASHSTAIGRAPAARRPGSRASPR
jgi:GNAT superfamily N-acetyltransferase